MSQNSEATPTMTAAVATLRSQRLPELSLRTLILHAPSMSLSLFNSCPIRCCTPAGAGNIQISLSGDISVKVKRRPIAVAVARVAGGIVGVAAHAGPALGTAVATVGRALRDEGQVRKLDVARSALLGLVHVPALSLLLALGVRAVRYVLPTPII